MTLRSWRYAALVVVMGAGLAACGDDDASDRPMPVDGGGGGIDSGGPGTDGGGGGDTDGGGVGTDGGGGRVCSIAGGACDVIMQNCPNATDGCYIAIIEEGGEPTTFCAAAGTRAEGEACDPAAVTQCLPGLGCDDGTCRRYCCDGRASDCPSGTGQICLSYNNAMPLGICQQPSGCTVVPQTGCDAGEACVFIAMDGATDCRMAGPAAPGAACGSGNLCQAGSACVTPPGGTAVCAPICRNGEAGDCPSGTCQGVDTFPATHGVCI